MRSVYITVTILFCLSRTSFAPFAGPYNIVPLELGMCPSSDCECPKFTFSNYKIRKLSRSSYVYSGTINSTVDISDDIKIAINVSSWGNGGWKPNFFYNEMLACSGLEKYLPEFKHEMFSRVNASCPAPAGVYTIENLSFVQESPVMQSLVYGKYKTWIKGYDKTGNCMGCVTFNCNIVPKPKKKQN
ncbi:uncharacterized protein LOC106664843 [Cimex lectularius]|uniref:MD-2-related lipid-recognition domain-containing protein n=1 Tax=Cimex lectularius TaxID=79782 RepID=A0A8I6RMW2_CIMLE|nr:uncharacterized protein LOC106664843 [Cimex lectularius]